MPKAKNPRMKCENNCSVGFKTKVLPGSTLGIPLWMCPRCGWWVTSNLMRTVLEIEERYGEDLESYISRSLLEVKKPEEC